MTGKGDNRRPTLRPTLAELGDQILREKDPDKKDELIRQWHIEKHWNDYKKQQGVYKHENTSD